MTMDIEIKAGLELDRAVAGVIGLKCTHRVLGSDVEYYVDPRDGTSGIPEMFRPSTDLNAAFAAAEAVELFKQYGYCQASGQDVISSTVPVASWADSIAHAPTPALAICAAILKLKKPSDTAAPS